MSRSHIRSVLAARHGAKAMFDRRPGWLWLTPRLVDTPCPACGSDQEVWCLCGDSGVTEFDFEYYHICLVCGHQANSNLNSHISPPVCPICGLGW
ncbi:hypothetical protein JW905_04570 [bacterium]|nr:hypothetical protein [candidate division CSSED10-310 bacterium]